MCVCLRVLWVPVWVCACVCARFFFLQGTGNVKYRDSKLTHLLKASLEGRCRLVMIANVNPSHVFFDDSHNTLKYANRAKNIKVKIQNRERSIYGRRVLRPNTETKSGRERQKKSNRLHRNVCTAEVEPSPTSPNPFPNPRLRKQRKSHSICAGRAFSFVPDPLFKPPPSRTNNL